MKLSCRLKQAVLASTLFANIGQAAAAVISNVVTTEQKTSVTGSIEITPTGQINIPLAGPAGDDGIEVDTAAAAILIDANNNFGNAIINNRADGKGINIPAGAGTAAAISIGEGSGIDSNLSYAIHIDNSNVAINNAGTLEGELGAIKISSGGVNAAIANEETGILQNSGSSEPTLYINGTGLAFANAGTVTGGSGVLAPAIGVNTSFAGIANVTDGLIDGGTKASGISILSAATGDIQNSGTITSSYIGPNAAAINLQGAYTGSITNNNGGLISITGAGSNAAILAANTFTNIINNTGATIEGLQSGNNAIRITTASPGALIYNAGLIQSLDQAAILLNKSIDQIINDGIIQSSNLSGGAVILANNAAGISMPNGIVNNGDIIDGLGTKAAIDLQTIGINNIPLFQEGGTISGNVLLASSGGTVLTMDGGVIDGNVTATPAQPNILNLNGGVISGIVQLGNQGDTVNLAGTALNILNGGNLADTFNVSGGSFITLDGKAGNNILNINSSFSLNGTINNIQTLHLQNAGTVLTVNQAIPSSVGITNLTLDANTAMVLNQNVATQAAGVVTNSGSITIPTLRSLSTNIYNQSGNYSVAIPANSANLGQILATSNVTLSGGSTISPYLIPGDFIVAQTPYNVIVSDTGVISDASIVVQPSSAVITFTKSGPAGVVCGADTCVQLIANRNTYSSLASTENAQAVAAVLDALVPNALLGDPGFVALFGQLDGLTSAQAVSDALLQLIPPYNYALVAGSHISMDSAFDSIQHRLADLRGLGTLWQEADIKLRRNDDFYNGLSYGDDCPVVISPYGAWIKVLGAQLTQKTRNNIEGYTAEAAGFALGGDIEFDAGAVGVAGSYTKSTVKDKSQDANDGIKSYQLTLYGWFNPILEDDGLFVDTMFGVASHEYDTLRYININALALSATAKFYGLQFGAQADVGYAFLSDEVYYVAPIARLKYTYLDIGNYTETGAGALSLSVTNNSLEELIAGVGLRFSLKRDYVQIAYFPEFSAMVLYDFIADPQQEIGNFLGGGAAFATTGNNPDALIYQFGFGLNAYSSDNYVFSLKYNLEVRDHFLQHSGFLKLEYRWG